MPQLWSNLRHEKMRAPSASASMDLFLEALLRVPQPSTRIIEAFAQLPVDCRVIFVSQKNDDRWDFVYSAVAYLTWPRKIEKVELSPNEKFPGVGSERTAVVFCGMPAFITLSDQRVLGPNLVLVGPTTSK